MNDLGVQKPSLSIPHVFSTAVAAERAGPGPERVQLYGDRGRDGDAAGRAQRGDDVSNQQGQNRKMTLHSKSLLR